MICSIPDCGKKTVARGLCSAHWQRWKRNGDANASKKIGDKKGANNGRWKGGEIGDGHGRIVIYSPGHPYPNYCGTHVYRYRLAMEKHLGRFLLPGEIVHHKNGNSADDRIENLELMTQSTHVQKHHGEMMTARKRKAGY